MVSDRIALRDQLLRAYRKAFRGERPPVAGGSLERQISDLTRALCTGVRLSPTRFRRTGLGGTLRRLI